MDCKQIPKMVIVGREFDNLDSELRSDIRLLQSSYAALRDLQDYDCPPVELSELNTQQIDQLTQERVERVLADYSLLPSEQEEKIKKYKSLHRIVVTELNRILRVINKWPECLFEYDESVRNFVPVADLRSVVEARCLRPVPELAKQHARLIDNVLQSVSKLREFEKSENLSKIRLEVLAAMTPERLGEMWADGTIQRKVYSADPLFAMARIGQEFSEKQYL